MNTAIDVLKASGVGHEKYSRWQPGGVYITEANQLIGSYSDLRDFRASARDHFGWHAHHIVECQDLERLSIGGHFPRREEQCCVLLPERAHIGRINSILRTQNPANIRTSIGHLRNAYTDAYAMIGDYCGGGESRIQQELVAIAEAIFRIGGLK